VRIETEHAAEFQSMLDGTIAGLAESFRRDLPEGICRDYMLWGVESENPNRADFLQLTGVTQGVAMTTHLLHGLVGSSDWAELSRYVGVLGAYQVYEIVSDNAAIGVAGLRRTDPGAGLRRSVLRSFNAGIMSRLGGDDRSGEQLLAGIRPQAARISIFDQSLAGAKHRHLARQFQPHNTQGASRLEHSLWDALVANLESAGKVADVVRTCRLGELIRQGLIDRYRAVDDLLAGLRLTPREVLTTGAHSILVVPVLAYYVAVLVELLETNPALGAVVDNNLLPGVLYDAALDVRLLNDVGTWALTAPADERDELCARLVEQAGHPEATDVVHGLLRVVDQADRLSRIRKDLEHGEFNICLHGVFDAGSRVEAARMFAGNLAWAATEHRKVRERLTRRIAALGDALSDPRPGEMIQRFVRFHHALYANSYDESVGEYAIYVCWRGIQLGHPVLWRG
jgi:hypothetical protein